MKVFRYLLDIAKDAIAQCRDIVRPDFGSVCRGMDAHTIADIIQQAVVFHGF